MSPREFFNHITIERYPKLKDKLPEDIKEKI